MKLETGELISDLECQLIISESECSLYPLQRVVGLVSGGQMEPGG